ncbi:lipase family protein [Nocardioides daejeonensis]|uniref:lipase family protein n=1 Tax=Nocardioides daejeonensis TaxID=1046556 RepID=UPI000D746522|nr:lipase family protein [Nocardioides daejeonensis]
MGTVARLVAAALVASLTVSVTAIDPADAARPKQPGRTIKISAAGETSQLAGARRAFVLRYSTRTVDARVRPATGLVLVPKGRRPQGGWPVVVYGHMTTGAADSCAPTRGTPDHPEKQKLEQGDDTTRALLAAGVLVLRPDYEGLGAPGPHPYLHGPSLARAMVDMLRALRTDRPRLVGDRWVVSGHSEGAVGALHVAAQSRLVPGMRLMGVSAFTPVTRMETLLNLLSPTPLGGPVIGELVALAALMLKGMSATDPEFEKRLLTEGLSPAARALWPHLERRCLAELSRTDSWGGLAPAQVTAPGAAGRRTVRELATWLAQHDVRRLHLRPALPVRLDLGVLDTVAPFPFTEELATTYRRQGNPVTVGRWPANHSPTNSAAFASTAAAAWMVRQLGR